MQENVADIRDRLTRFFNFYNPDKLGNVDRILEAYLGDYDALFQDLLLQYGPEPDIKGNLPRGTASEARSRSGEQSLMGPPSSHGYSPSNLTHREGPNQQGYAESNTTRQVRQVSRGYYAGGYRQDAADSARDIVYEAQVIAELHHHNEGPSSVEEVEWWKEQDRLTRDGALRVSAGGEKSMKGYRPPTSATDHHTPNRSRLVHHESSFTGTSRPNVGYSPKEWGKSTFQSPTPKKPAKPLPYHGENFIKDKLAHSPIRPDLANKLSASPGIDQTAPYDVICVRCGHLAKMTANGAIVPGSHPPHVDSPPKTPPQLNTPQVRPLPTEHPSTANRSTDTLTTENSQLPPLKQAAELPSSPSNTYSGASAPTEEWKPQSKGRLEPTKAPSNGCTSSYSGTSTPKVAPSGVDSPTNHQQQHDDPVTPKHQQQPQRSQSGTVDSIFDDYEYDENDRGITTQSHQHGDPASPDPASPFHDSPTGTGGESSPILPARANSGRKPLQHTDTRTNRPRPDPSSGNNVEENVVL